MPITTLSAIADSRKIWLRGKAFSRLRKYLAPGGRRSAILAELPVIWEKTGIPAAQLPELFE